MSLLKGSLSVRRFLVLGPVPNEAALQAGLEQDQFRPFQDGLEEERLGWCDWRNPMICPPEEAWVMQERFGVFGLRIDTRRVPAAILKARVELRLQDIMKEKDLAFIGKEARQGVQEEIKAELLRKVMPSPRVFECAWDLKGGILWTTAASAKAQGALIGLFMKSFGVELQPMCPVLIAGRLVSQFPTECLMALDPLNLEVEEVVHG